MLGISSSSKELKRVTQDLYKKNLDLVTANKELAMIQKLYEIMTSTTSIKDLSQEFINVIVKDLSFVGGAVVLKDPTNKFLYPVALAQTPYATQKLKMLGTLASNKIPLSRRSNVLVEAYHGSRRIDVGLKDPILTFLDPSEIETDLLEKFNARATAIYPLLVNDNPIGVLLITLNRPVKDLPESDKKILKRVSIVFGVALDRIMLFHDLREANKRLKNLDKMKDEFLSIASHELRTPMTAIKSYLWMILNKSTGNDHFTAKTSHYLNRAYISTERLLALVNDMLDVSRIEAGRIELHLAEIDLLQLIKQVIDELSVKAQEKHMDISIVETEINTIHADQDKLHQVLLNLVGNAIKFTPSKGKIKISFRQDETFVHCSIADTGKGIAQEDITRLFTKFGRLEQSFVSVAESGGTGLGLFICNQIITKHGGRITVESTLGEGSNFTFTIPRF